MVNGENECGNISDYCGRYWGGVKGEEKGDVGVGRVVDESVGASQL